MGHNPSTNRFKQARLGLDAQQAVDEYKARSVWGMWWTLDERLRRRFFNREERAFITRYGARLDEIACHRTNPANEKEVHFLQVCIGTAEPASPRERLWLLVQLVCRYQRVVDRAARADLAEHDAAALRAENRALKAQVDHYERRMLMLQRDLDEVSDDATRALRNITWMTPLFASSDSIGPAPRRFTVDLQHRATPVGMLTVRGLEARC